MEKIIYKIVDSPLGKFVAGASPSGCCIFEFLDRGGLKRITSRVEKRYKMKVVRGKSQLNDRMEMQVKEYFRGKRKAFKLPLDLKGTEFEVMDWLELLRIPYGETRSYKDIAVAMGKPGAARAVGRANGANFLPIIIPCHRVIEANGNLRGYGGKLWRKKYLLEMEKRFAEK